jgi:periplasmic divalent cation tolerance protein
VRVDMWLSWQRRTMAPFWKGRAMEVSLDRDILAVTTTVGKLEDAQALARGLVERRLAACVQVDPGMLSFYRWEGQPCEGAEVRVTIKTLPRQRAALEAFFAEHHPYDVPQFLAVTMQGSAAYAEWARQELA